MTARPESGTRRKVIFQAWCHRGLCHWSGTERDTKWMAEIDRAQHEVNKHGGARRGTDPGEP